MEVTKGLRPRNQCGAYVAWGAGEDGAPTVHLLDPDAMRQWERISAINVDSSKAAPLFFGSGMAYAVPCAAATMELLAINYTGPHSGMLRALCAHIALGRAIGDTGGDQGGGGSRVAAPVRSPRGGGGKGATFNVPAVSGVAS